MSNTKPTAEQLLDLIERRARGLRAAGVRRVELEGIVFDLADPDPVPQQFEREEIDEPMIYDALDDPTTFGGGIPTLSRGDE